MKFILKLETLYQGYQIMLAEYNETPDKKDKLISIDRIAFFTDRKSADERFFSIVSRIDNLHFKMVECSSTYSKNSLNTYYMMFKPKKLFNLEKYRD